MVIVYHVKMSLDTESTVTNTAPGVFSHVLSYLQVCQKVKEKKMSCLSGRHFSVYL